MTEARINQSHSLSPVDAARASLFSSIAAREALIEGAVSFSFGTPCHEPARKLKATEKPATTKIRDNVILEQAVPSFTPAISDEVGIFPEAQHARTVTDEFQPTPKASGIDYKSKPERRQTRRLRGMGKVGAAIGLVASLGNATLAQEPSPASIPSFEPTASAEPTPQPTDPITGAVICPSPEPSPSPSPEPSPAIAEVRPTSGVLFAFVDNDGQVMEVTLDQEAPSIPPSIKPEQSIQPTASQNPETAAKDPCDPETEYVFSDDLDQVQDDYLAGLIPDPENQYYIYGPVTMNTIALNGYPLKKYDSLEFVYQYLGGKIVNGNIHMLIGLEDFNGEKYTTYELLGLGTKMNMGYANLEVGPKEYCNPTSLTEIGRIPVLNSDVFKILNDTQRGRNIYTLQPQDKIRVGTGSYVPYRIAANKYLPINKRFFEYVWHRDHNKNPGKTPSYINKSLDEIITNKIKIPFAGQVISCSTEETIAG